MDASSKLTLYDMLAMVIPGFLLLLLMNFIFDCKLLSDKNDIYSIFLVFVASYITGLIWNKFMEKAFRYFRNSSDSIEKETKKFYQGYKEEKTEAKAKGETDPVKKAEIEAKIEAETKDYIKKKSFKYEYYKAYYILMKNNCLYNIPTLEAQVAFIRNMLPIISLYIIAICCSDEICRFLKSLLIVNSCCTAILLFVAGIAMYYIMNRIQNKIYYLIWEGAQYLEDIENGYLLNNQNQPNNP
jgi:hypothetical protein